VLPSRLAVHKVKCPYYFKKCETCKQTYHPNQTSASHDCVAYLLKSKDRSLKEEALFNLDIGINYERMGENFNCPCGKKMKTHSGLALKCMSRYGVEYPNCSKCQRADIFFYDLYYNCEDLKCKQKYYICRMCALESGENPILNPEPCGTKFPSIHDHQL